MVLKGASLAAVLRMFHTEEASIHEMNIHFIYPLMNLLFSISVHLLQNQEKEAIGGALLRTCLFGCAEIF